MWHHSFLIGTLHRGPFHCRFDDQFPSGLNAIFAAEQIYHPRLKLMWIEKGTADSTVLAGCMGKSPMTDMERGKDSWFILQAYHCMSKRGVARYVITYQRCSSGCIRADTVPAIEHTWRPRYAADLTLCVIQSTYARSFLESMPSKVERGSQDRACISVGARLLAYPWIP